MLKWQATLHTQENSDGLHDIHWRCELLSQEGGLDQFIVWMWKRSQSLTVDGIEARQLSRTGVSSVYVTSESSVLCLIGRIEDGTQSASHLKPSPRLVPMVASN